MKSRRVSRALETNNKAGSDDQQTSKNRPKDTSLSAIKCTYLKSTNEQHVQFVFRPNRRFPGTLRISKREFKTEKEHAPDGSERIYSSLSTNGNIYLARISNHDHDPLKPIKLEASLAPLKYPQMNSFLSKKGFRSIMVLHNYEIRKMARLGGKIIVSEFNPQSKSNPTLWPYPCSRPFFKTCWLFRTLSSRTLASLALQLRIIWCCLRWDDMTARPPTNNGKIVTNTDTGIVSTEILKHRVSGRFSEKNEYLRLTLLIPYGYADPQPSKGIKINFFI